MTSNDRSIVFLHANALGEVVGKFNDVLSQLLTIQAAGLYMTKVTSFSHKLYSFLDNGLFKFRANSSTFYLLFIFRAS